MKQKPNIIPPYLPNFISLSTRIFYFFATLGLIAYGAWGIWLDDLILPAKRGGVHLHGIDAWLMYIAFICACIVMCSIIVDHYDQRDNEIKYHYFCEKFRRLGWFFFYTAITLHILRALIELVIKP